MKKETILKILCGILVVAVVGVGIFVFTSKNNNEDKPNDNSGTSEVDNGDGKTNGEKGDFWISSADIPSDTRKFPIKLFDDVAGLPIDLSKLENSDYTFNYTIYSADPNASAGNYSVHSISEIKGSYFDGAGGKKRFAIKNGSGDLLFNLDVHPTCNNKNYDSFVDAIRNNCWDISLDISKISNKEFTGTADEKIKQKVQEIFNIFGKPTHIYIRNDEELVMKDNGIGQLTSDIIYEYGNFTLEARLLDTYNKEHDYRLLDFYGLNYVPKNGYSFEYGEGTSHSKDVVNQLVK